LQGKTCKEMQIGDKAEFSKSITEADLVMFAGITGDMNPVHVNSEFAKMTAFGKRIVHGILSIGLISNVLGTQLPGPGVLYLNQTCKFLKPVFIGDTITAMVEVTAKDESLNKVRLRTYCFNQNNQLVVDGEAMMMPRKEAEEKTA